MAELESSLMKLGAGPGRLHSLADLREEKEEGLGAASSPGTSLCQAQRMEIMESL